MVLLWMQERSVRGLSRLARRFASGRPLPAHLETGIEGEREALFHLRRVGYTVVARRWTSARVRGDLDIVAWRGATLCFVEVKSRTTRDAIAAETAVDRAKRIQLRRLARAYLAGFEEPARREISTRFIVVSVYLLATGSEYEVLEDAFGWAERA